MLYLPVCDITPNVMNVHLELGRIEEGKGVAYTTKVDVPCNDRNRTIERKQVLIATEGPPLLNFLSGIPL